MEGKQRSAATITTTLPRLRLCLAAALLTLAWLPASAVDKCMPACKPDNKEGDYRQTNLVSNLPDVALLQDPDLTNAWGISFAATSPFWVSDNGSGLATLYSVTYDSNGVVQVTKAALVVTIPGEGVPTGQLFNGTGAFNNDIFIFAGEDGTISGWRGTLGTAAEILVLRTNAVYKGIALITTAKGPELLAANFREATLDAYDTNLVLVAQYKDPKAPKGYAPFNVQLLDGMVFVTFAKQDAAKHDDVAGPGNGLIDVFNPVCGMFHRFATGKNAGGKLKEINSPWGLALSPKGFGEHGDELLVGNFGGGTIMAFNECGEFKGLLEGPKEKPIVIDGLWGLKFGNGGSGGRPETLYFSAGPDGESNGLFGALDAVPERKPGRGNCDDEDRGNGNGNGNGNGKGNGKH